MKKQFFPIVLLAAVCLVLCTSFAKDSCNSDPTYQKALAKIKEFNLIKDYRVYIKKKKKGDPPTAVYFPVTMNRGERYRFYGLESPEYKGKMVVTIYNNMKREFPVATTYNQATQTKLDAIEFKSGSTGTFCIGFYFLDGEEGCGVGISSFKKE